MRDSTQSYKSLNYVKNPYHGNTTIDSWVSKFEVLKAVTVEINVCDILLPFSE
jgi:hypothetical protein